MEGRGGQLDDDDNNGDGNDGDGDDVVRLLAHPTRKW